MRGVVKHAKEKKKTQNMKIHKMSSLFRDVGSSRALRRGSQLTHMCDHTTPRPAPGAAPPESLAPAPSWQDPSWQDPSERCGIHLLPVNLVKC